MKLKFIGESPKNEIPENERFIIEVSDSEWIKCRTYPYKTCMTATLVDAKEFKGFNEGETVGDVRSNYLNPFFCMDNDAWPGGYPKFFVSRDGDALSFKAVRKHFREVVFAMRHPRSDISWEIMGCEINWEDPSLFCADSNKRIESAYAEDQVEA